MLICFLQLFTQTVLGVNVTGNRFWRRDSISDPTAQRPSEFATYPFRSVNQNQLRLAYSLVLSLVQRLLMHGCFGFDCGLLSILMAIEVIVKGSTASSASLSPPFWFFFVDINLDSVP